MGPERIELSQTERDRLKVLHEVEQGHLRQGEAGRRLGLSERQVRRLLGQREARGDRAVVHGLRGRPSNRKIAEAFRQRVIEQVRQRYSDFGPTLASEHLAAEGMKVSRETLRKWMAEAKLWRVRYRPMKQIHVWRGRKAAFAEMVMLGNSPHAWVEDRGPPLPLIAVIDDGTSRAWGAFARQDGIEENLRSRDAHRPLGGELCLESILSVREPRVVTRDYTVSWHGQRWGVAREHVQAGLRGARVEIERRLDRSHWLRFRGQSLPLVACPAAPPSLASPSGLRPPGLANDQTKPKYIPPPDHPWRKPWKRTFLNCK